MPKDDKHETNKAELRHDLTVTHMHFQHPDSHRAHWGEYTKCLAILSTTLLNLHMDFKVIRYAAVGTTHNNTADHCKAYVLSTRIVVVAR